MERRGFAQTPITPPRSAASSITRISNGYRARSPFVYAPRTPTAIKNRRKTRRSTRSARSIDSRPFTEESRNFDDRGSPIGYAELDWIPLVVGREEPSVFAEGINDYEGGWISEPDSSYPIDVILAFPHVCDVHKLRIGGIDMLPRKIEISAGRAKREDADPTHETARHADFRRRAVIRFAPQTPTDEAEEVADIKDVFIESEAQYLWLLLHAPYPHKENHSNQIRLTTLIIEGYEIRQPIRARWSRSMSRNFQTPPRRLLTVESEFNERNLIESRRHRIRTAEEDRRSIRSLTMTPLSPRRRPRSIDSIGVRSERSMKMPGPAIGNLDTTDDPLASIRLVRNAVAERRRRAQKRGRDIEATVCRRAIERLDASATEIRQLRAKLEDARQRRDPVEIERLTLALKDCRDTTFRIIHADLLLDDSKLQAIGYENFNESGIRRRDRD
ncbi:hypothetical protein M3Y98_00933800 [Aphelenchoides besseyi]|nr:hypothetical protein M3Y98_00933800 [Aphelenchoides besseyi]KAI6194257.1 hypothetical protein M3Y96_01106000 [Aphelenchoides besseyi]